MMILPLIPLLLIYLFIYRPGQKWARRRKLVLVGNVQKELPPSGESRIGRCPRCGSSSYELGCLEDVAYRGIVDQVNFFPSNLAVHAFVCLNCGMLTPCLLGSFLEKVRARNHEHSAPAERPREDGPSSHQVKPA
jgi:hypothetical protein